MEWSSYLPIDHREGCQSGEEAPDLRVVQVGGAAHERPARLGGLHSYHDLLDALAAKCKVPRALLLEERAVDGIAAREERLGGGQHFGWRLRGSDFENHGRSGREFIRA